MLQFGLPILFALFLWWFSTGAILYLDRLPRRTYGWTMLAASALLLAALAGLRLVQQETGAAGVYLGFACALVAWGWNEMAFLTGAITGSQRVACPADLRGLPRFRFAVEMVIYHELAIVAVGLLVLAVSWGGANTVGVWTYLLLWAMRLSTKLNLFLGVPNAPVAFLPDHLSYLASGFRHRAMNWLFPLSVTACAIVLAVLAMRALAPDAAGAGTIAPTLLAALVALGLLEHWFLVLPIPSASLWGVRAHAASAPGAGGSISGVSGLPVPAIAVNGSLAPRIREFGPQRPVEAPLGGVGLRALRDLQG